MTGKHRLFERQVKKFLPDDLRMDARMRDFLDAVEQSYRHFEENRMLVEHAMRIGSDELYETNRRLLDESTRQKELIGRLKRAIEEVMPGYFIADTSDLGRISEALEDAIAERKKIEQELVEAREIAEASLRTRQVFLANISHEIRTPIHAISGMAAILLDTELSGSQQRYARAIRTSAESLTVIINDILDMSKLESGKFTLEEIPFGLHDMLGSVLQSLSLRAEEKGVELRLEPEGDLPEWLSGDPTRIRQVLLNLLSNAVKFTEKGYVRLSCRVNIGDDGKEYICFSVEDTGVGISRDRLDGIFEQFMQEDDSVTRRFGGTGLGLSISRSLVELMDGTIHVTSEKGVGSVFWFELPLRTAEPPVAEGPEEEDYSDFSGLRVLVVDDNEMNRFLAITILGKWNARVDTASDGVEALELMKAGEYDCVLLDIQMPRMDGMQLIRIVREEFSAALPVIALSANASDSEREECIQAGMSDYISKPFRLSELARGIARLCQIRIAELSAMERERYREFTLDRLNEMYGGNAGHVRRTAEIFIGQITSDLEQLEQAVARRDFPAVRTFCHKVEPNLDLFGARQLLLHIGMLREACSEGASRELDVLFRSFRAGILGLCDAIRSSLS
jgi:two-component system, sensor histidine kinase